MSKANNMSKGMKIIVGIFLVLLMIVSVMPLSKMTVYAAESTTCPNCNGNKTISQTCTACRGTGKEICRAQGCNDGRVDCTVCDNDHKITCPTCNGRGGVVCDECHGEPDGCVKCDDAGQITCSTCNGAIDGKILCTTCSGTGRHDCSTCNGTGHTETNCTSCNGTKTVSVTCPTCNGSGQTGTLIDSVVLSNVPSKYKEEPEGTYIFVNNEGETVNTNITITQGNGKFTINSTKIDDMYLIIVLRKTGSFSFTTETSITLKDSSNNDVEVEDKALVTAENVANMKTYYSIEDLSVGDYVIIPAITEYLSPGTHKCNYWMTYNGWKDGNGHSIAEGNILSKGMFPYDGTSYLNRNKMSNGNSSRLTSNALVVKIDGEKIYLCSNHNPSGGTTHQGYCESCGRNSEGAEYVSKTTTSASDFTFTAPTTLTAGEARSASVTTSKGGMGAITVYYSSNNGSTWSTTAPSTAGTYKVAIDVAEGTSYTAGTKITDDTWTFTLSPSKSTPSADDFVYKSSTGKVEAATGKSLGTITTYYKVNGSWTTTKPTDKGTYDVGVTASGSDTFNSIGTSSAPFTSTWKYTVEAKSEDESNDDGEVKVPAEKQTGNFATGGLKNSAAEVKSAVLTDTDKAAIEAGKDVNVWVEIEDQSKKVAKEDKESVEEKLPTNYNVGLYLDVTLWKQATGSEATKVTETPNGKVKIGFIVPKELQKEGRIYKIIRVHNGEATVLDAAVDSNFGLTFETDLFSTYALVYEEKDASGSTETKTEETPKAAETTKTVETPKATTSPKTGDSTDMYLWILMIMAGLSMVGAASYKKFRE